MSIMKGKLRRSAVVVAFTLGAFQALSIVGASSAFAAVGPLCSVASGVVTISTDSADDTFRVYADQNGGIHVAEAVANALPSVGILGDDLPGCTGVQTGLNTTTAINITGASGTGTQDQTAWIEMSTVDATATDTFTGDLTNWGSINWTVSLGANDSVGDSLEIVNSADTSSDADLNVTGGANGFDLNSDGNLDVTQVGTENFYVDSAADSTGNCAGNTEDLSGSTITGGPFTSGALLGWSSVDTGLNKAFDAGVANTQSLQSGTDAGMNVVKGGSGNDNLSGGFDGDLLAPGLGSDQISGGGQDICGWFGDGQDTIDYSNTTTAINVNLVGNTVSQGSDIDTLVTTADNIDDVIGTSAADTIVGNDDDNWIEPGAGNDSVDGGVPGDNEDTYDVEDATAGVTVDLGAGTSTGGSGTDTLVRISDVNGSEFNDVITGGPTFQGEDNSLWGNGGNDVLSGGAGDGDGADFFDGGSGIDTLSYANNTLPTNVDLTDATASGIAGENDDLQPNTIENAILGSGDDTFTGTAFNNIVWPNGGQNALLGGAGGIDTVNYSMGYTTGVTVNLTGGGAAGGNQDSITGFTNAVGTAFNDTLLGTDVVAATNGANLLVGGKGNDVISANAGPDLVRAGAGNDNVRAGQGDDTVWGQGGNDNVRGGQGDDNINGGKGRDTCFGGGGHDVVHCEKGHKASHARLANFARQAAMRP